MTASPRRCRISTMPPNWRSFAAAPDAPALDAGEMARIAELARGNFGLVSEEPHRYKGTMEPPAAREEATDSAELAQPAHA